MNKKIVITAQTAAFCVLLHGAHAQESSATPALDTRPDTEIGEIVVTAQKRSERLLDVPISITAVTAEQLNDTASKNLEELQGVVPGVTIPAATSYGGSSIVIRGTSGSGTFLEDDPVAVYVDGIYQPSNSRFAVSDLTDVQSVEIVRGPQGTLQGRNATAGAILVRTIDPSSSFDGAASVSFANPEEGRISSAVSLPITDTFRVRLSGDYFDQRGWARNLYDGSHLGGERASNGRAVFLWLPVEHFTARLALNYQKLTNTQALQRWAATTVNPTGVAVTAPTPFASLPTAQENFYLDNKVVNNSIHSGNTQESPAAALELHYDFGPMELVSLTGGSKASNRGSAYSGGMDTTGINGVSLVDAVTGELRRGYNQGYITGSQSSEELRLQSPASGRFKWLAGGYYSHAIDDFQFNIFNDSFTTQAPGDNIVGFAAHQLDNSYAAFADATFNVTDRLAVTGGVRYTDEQKTFNNTFSVTIPQIDLIVAGPLAYAPPERTWVDTSYRANIAYRLTDDTNVYVSTSRGFKSGGFNAFGVGPAPAFNPEYLYSTELGLKSYFLERRGYVAASVYKNHYDNLQVTAGVPTGGVNIYNAAKASIKGTEIEGQFKFTERLALTANAAYTDAHYTDFQLGQGLDGNLVNATGNTLPNTPTWQYFLQGDYRVPLNSVWESHAQVSYRWRSKVYFFATNETPNLAGGSDPELGARLDFTYNPQKINLALYGKNLTDTRIINGEQAQFAYPVAFFNEPRVVGLQISKQF
jgi:iron complex outermembrane receptor protein